jgi:hypothetical protein
MAWKSKPEHPGCWNQPRPDPNGGYWAKDRVYQPDGRFMEVPIFVKFTMTPLCQQDGALAECQGCKHIQANQSERKDQDGQAPIH